MQPKPGVIKMKTTQNEIYETYLVEVGQNIHIWTFHRECCYNSNLIGDLSDIIEALTQTILDHIETSYLDISSQLSL